MKTKRVVGLIYHSHGCFYLSNHRLLNSDRVTGRRDSEYLSFLGPVHQRRFVFRFLSSESDRLFCQTLVEDWDWYSPSWIKSKKICTFFWVLNNLTIFKVSNLANFITAHLTVKLTCNSLIRRRCIFVFFLFCFFFKFMEVPFVVSWIPLF